MNSSAKTIAIFGSSGMAREAGDIAHAVGLEPLYIVRDDELNDPLNDGLFVISEDDVLQYSHLPFLIGIANVQVRAAIAARYDGKLQFTSLIHPSATFGHQQRQEIETSKGVIVAAGVRFTNKISVGDHCIFNQNVTVAHDCIISDFVHIAPGANVSGNVTIKSGAWIGAGAVINQGDAQKPLQIGENAIIGSGAVVTSDCEANKTYIGVPARRLK